MLVVIVGLLDTFQKPLNYKNQTQSFLGSSNGEGKTHVHKGLKNEKQEHFLDRTRI